MADTGIPAGGLSLGVPPLTIDVPSIAPTATSVGIEPSLSAPTLTLSTPELTPNLQPNLTLGVDTAMTVDPAIVAASYEAGVGSPELVAMADGPITQKASATNWGQVSAQIAGAVSNALGLATDVVNQAAQQQQLNHQIRLEDAAMTAAEKRQENAARAQDELVEAGRKIGQRQNETARTLSSTKRKYESLKAEIDANNQLASNKAAIDAREVLTPRFNGSPVA